MFVACLYRDACAANKFAASERMNLQPFGIARQKRALSGHG